MSLGWVNVWYNSPSGVRRARPLNLSDLQGQDGQDANITDAWPIHSVFIGRSTPPRILRTVSQVTGGIHFQVAPDRNGVLRITQMIS